MTPRRQTPEIASEQPVRRTVDPATDGPAAEGVVDRQAPPPGRPGLWPALAGRLRGRADSEHEQILVRLGIAAGILASLAVVALSGHAPPAIGACLLIAGAYLIGSVGLLAHLVWRTAPNPARRCAGMLLDLVLLPFGMIVGGALVAPLYPFFLWITLGMGFRYGRPYLFAAAALSLAGFAVVIALTEYWRSQLVLSASLWVALLVIPAYTASLLTKLTDAVSRAEEASRTKSRFLATMSHELRTPLHAIIGMADLLRRTRLEAEQQDMVRTVRSAGQSLLDMIGDVLAVARSEAGQITEQAVDFDLHRLLATVRALLHHQAAGKGLELRLQVDPAAPYALRGAARSVQQILLNLVANAIKFTERGHVTIRLVAETVGSEQAALRIDVQDTGIGIPLEAQERIFELFTQADESTTRRYGGTGLGLAIARQLAGLMEGSLTVESEPDVGSCFTFRAPFARSSGAPERLDGRIVLAGRGPAATLLWRRLTAWGAEVTLITRLDDRRELLARMAQERSALVIGPGLLLDGPAPAPCDLKGLANEPIGMVRIGPGAHEALDGYLSVLAPEADDKLLFVAMHAALAAPQVPDTETTPAARHGEGRRVLVAEDNRINQKVIERMLASGGHVVTLVGDGEQALDALEAETFDLVLMDLNMPVMGGLDALKLHRFATGGRDLPPFVALTADATEETRRKCAEAGMDACVTKPVDVAHLLEVVDRLTRSKPDVGGGRAAPSAEVVPHPRWGGGTPALDPSYLERLRQLDPEDDFLVAIIEDFTADAEHLIDELAAAAAAGDAEAFRDRAHALRSSAAHIGASALFELCLGWRGISSTELGNDGAAHVARLGSEFERLRTALLAVLAELPPSGRPALRQPH